MIGREQLERLWSSLLGLGARRLAALALVGITVFAAVGLAATISAGRTWRRSIPGSTRRT